MVFDSESFFDFDGRAAQSFPMKEIVRALIGHVVRQVSYATVFNPRVSNIFRVARPRVVCLSIDLDECLRASRGTWQAVAARRIDGCAPLVAPPGNASVWA